jgi:SAM-dependent methyltransferase
MTITTHELSVWPVAQTPARIQRNGRYIPESFAHPGKMLPALARTAIERYSQPGELVLDPMCGIGTTLVEAIHAGRRAIGVELEGRWAALAAANVGHARAQGARGQALVQHGDARMLGRGLLDELAGQAALILTSPPYGPSTHGLVNKRHGRLQKTNWRYGHDRGNLAHLPSQTTRTGRPGFLDAFAEILEGCRRMLAPHGVLVLTARAYRRHGQLVDLPGQLITIAKDAGLELYARHAALLCGLRDERLVPRASFFQLRWQRTGQIPRMQLIAHEDVLVFTPAKQRQARRQRPTARRRQMRQNGADRLEIRAGSR